MLRSKLRYATGMAACVTASAVFAQAGYPNRPITTVVGFAPGGGTDLVSRTVGQRLSQNLGQNVNIENRAGAGGNIAAALVAKANPDGYTIMLAAVGSLTVAPHLDPKLAYSPQRDFAPITMATVFANVLLVHPSVAANNVADYIRIANAKPGHMTYGSSGIGGAGHLAGELLKLMAKVDLTHVPYKGGGPAMTDLIGGQIPSYFAAAPTAAPPVKAGKVRAIATTGAVRSAFLPDVPTIAESGYPGYVATNWYAYVAPAKVPRDIIQRLNREIVAVLNTPEVRDQLIARGAEPAPSTPEELAKTIETELVTWGRVVKEAKIQAE
jgi:tripartite-type tricarboxylate transporter receptor subunit TctC